VVLQLPFLVQLGLFKLLWGIVVALVETMGVSTLTFLLVYSMLLVDNHLSMMDVDPFTGRLQVLLRVVDLNRRLFLSQLLLLLQRDLLLLLGILSHRPKLHLMHLLKLLDSLPSMTTYWLYLLKNNLLSRLDSLLSLNWMYLLNNLLSLLDSADKLELKCVLAQALRLVPLVAPLSLLLVPWAPLVNNREKLSPVSTLELVSRFCKHSNNLILNKCFKANLFERDTTAQRRIDDSRIQTTTQNFHHYESVAG
jgi:hypothetical protein